MPDLDYPEIVGGRAVEAKPFAAFIEPDDDLFFAPHDNIAAIGEVFGKNRANGRRPQRYRNGRAYRTWERRLR